ncbi:MAG: SapC family protein [Pseudomonadota bacterium]
MALPIFYNKPVVLSSQIHADLRLQVRNKFHFAAGSNSVALKASEFAQACHEYPIVFVQDKDSGTVNPVAVLGLKERQNLFVDATGRWDATYVPAYIRRYPFILATQGEEGEAPDYKVCIDEAYTGFSRDKGERLFLDDGEQSDYLKRALNLLQDYQAHSLRTAEFARRLQDWGLLQPLQASVEMRTGDKMALTGFMAVDQKKLKALPAERLAELVQKDELGVIYYHLLSLNNFGRLVDRMAEAA